MSKSKRQPSTKAQIDFKNDLVDVAGADFAQLIVADVLKDMCEYMASEEVIKFIHKQDQLSSLPNHAKRNMKYTSMLGHIIDVMLGKWSLNYPRNPFSKDPMLRRCVMKQVYNQVQERMKQAKHLTEPVILSATLCQTASTRIFLFHLWPIVAMLRTQYPLTKLDAGNEHERKLFLSLWYDRVVGVELAHAVNTEDLEYLSFNPSREPTKYASHLVVDHVEIYGKHHPVHHLQSHILPRLTLGSTSFYQTLLVLYLEIVARVCYSSDYCKTETAETMMRHVTLWLRKSLAKSLVSYLDQVAHNHGANTILEKMLQYSSTIKRVAHDGCVVNNKETLIQIDRRIEEELGLCTEKQGVSINDKLPPSSPPKVAGEYERFFFDQAPRDVYKKIGHLTLVDAHKMHTLNVVTGKLPDHYDFPNAAAFLMHVWPEYMDIDKTMSEPGVNPVCSLLEVQQLALCALFAESPAFSALPLHEKISDGATTPFNFCKASFATKFSELLINNFKNLWHPSSVHNTLQWSVGDIKKVTKTCVPLFDCVGEALFKACNNYRELADASSKPIEVSA